MGMNGIFATVDEFDIWENPEDVEYRKHGDGDAATPDSDTDTDGDAG